MAQLHSYRQVQAGEYNRATDPGLGAVGSVNTGVHIPRFALVTGFWVTPLTAITGTAGVFINFGFQTTDSPLILSAPLVFFPATAPAAFVPFTPVAGMPFGPQKMLNSVDVMLFIDGAPGDSVTSGILDFIIEYIELDK